MQSAYKVIDTVLKYVLGIQRRENKAPTCKSSRLHEIGVLSVTGFKHESTYSEFYSFVVGGQH